MAAGGIAREHYRDRLRESPVHFLADACVKLVDTIDRLRLGIHTSIAGSLEKSAHIAAGLGAGTFQIFSASPRMWQARVPEGAAVRRLASARERFDLHPLAIHVNYLVNLASTDPVVRAKSIGAFRGELERARAIGADYLVLHPGSYRGRAVEDAIRSFAVALGDAARGFRHSGLTVLIENTAGSGYAIGSRFEELRLLRDEAGALTDLPVGFCLDTCHLLASGYDIASAAGLRITIRSAGAVLGWDSVRLIHANDSKTPLGSRVDRHENIGEGHIGAAGFRRLLRHPRLRTKPFILETPVRAPGDDRRNLDALKRLAG